MMRNLRLLQEDDVDAADRMDVSPLEVGQTYLELHHRLHRIVDQAMSSAGLSLARAKVLMRLSEPAR